MIEFHDPTGASAQTVESYDLVFNMAANAENKPTIGLLANGFADSERFLSLIGDAITARFPSVNLKLWNKGNASIPAPEGMLQEIRESCHAVVAAYGH